VPFIAAIPLVTSHSVYSVTTHNDVVFNGAFFCLLVFVYRVLRAIDATDWFVDLLTDNALQCSCQVTIEMAWINHYSRLQRVGSDLWVASGTALRADMTIGILIINAISMASLSIQQQGRLYNNSDSNSDVENWEPASTSWVWCCGLTVLEVARDVICDQPSGVSALRKWGRALYGHDK